MWATFEIIQFEQETTQNQEKALGQVHVHSNIFVNHWKFWIKCELLLALFTS